MIKTQATKKEILNGFKYVIPISYCGAQNLLNYKSANYYTYSKMYGWRADVYVINNDIALVTGYAPFGNVIVDYGTLKSFENKAESVYNTVRDYNDRKTIINSYLLEFIKKTTGAEVVQ